VAAVARFTASGAPDTSFSSDGFATVTLSGYTRLLALDVAIDMANNYTISGQAYKAASNAAVFLFARLLPSGAYDTTWSADGRVVTSFGVDTEAWGWRGVFPLNFFAPALVVMGYVVTADGEWRLASVGYNPDGSLNVLWGNAGVAVTQIGSYPYAEFGDALTNGDGRLIVFGGVEN
jgi:hypothetical protein